MHVRVHDCLILHPIGTLITRVVILQVLSSATHPQLGNDSEVVEEEGEEGVAASVSDEAVDVALRALEVLAACPQGRTALGLQPPQFNPSLASEGDGGGQRTIPIAGSERVRDTLSAALLGLLGVVESSQVGGARRSVFDFLTG